MPETHNSSANAETFSPPPLIIVKWLEVHTAPTEYMNCSYIHAAQDTFCDINTVLQNLNNREYATNAVKITQFIWVFKIENTNSFHHSDYCRIKQLVICWSVIKLSHLPTGRANSEHQGFLIKHNNDMDITECFSVLKKYSAFRFHMLLHL